MRIYESMFEYTSKLSWQEVREVAKEFVPTLQELTPHILAEMQGIAEGAEVDLLDVVALNCRSEIALGKFSDGCTTLCWKKNANARVLSQNWDWTATVKQNLAMVSIEQLGKPTIFMITEVRQLAELNSTWAGLIRLPNYIRQELSARLALIPPPWEHASMQFVPSQ